MLRIRWEALVVACWLLAGCKEACVEQVGSDVTKRDFSDLRLTGDYRCNLQSTCTVAVNETSVVFAVKNSGGGPQFRIDYRIHYGAPKQDKLNVTQDVSVDPRCGTTEKYREETWTVPSVSLEAESATQDGRPLDLAEDVLILNHKSSLLRKLVVTQHFVDVRKNEEYLGVEVTTEPASYIRMPITRTGASFTIGPRD